MNLGKVKILIKKLQINNLQTSKVIEINTV